MHPEAAEEEGDIVVAYSFKPRFIDPILSGRKQQTIRAVGRRRHARGGDDLQLYTGMRTRACRLIGRAVCIEAGRITLRFGRDTAAVLHGGLGDISLKPDLFAQQDGFSGWKELEAFWEIEHAAEFQAGRFDGVMIVWRGFAAA